MWEIVDVGDIEKENIYAVIVFYENRRMPVLLYNTALWDLRSHFSGHPHCG
jgi:hypothetical protein